MTFEEKYTAILNTVKDDIDRVADNLTEGIYVQESLKTRIIELLKAPSKHIRPLVSFLYLKAAGAKIDENQILYQAAIELVHNASLIHDDVIDESSVRRGVKTLNSTFDNKLAVISGDYLLSVALNKVLKTGSIELIEMFSDTLAVMSNGEINQYFDKYKIPAIESYIKKSEQKTAKLFETSLCGSLLLAGSNQNGYEFAKNFGIAFQIRDDLINVKTNKTDIDEGIYTAPVIFSGSLEINSDGIEKTVILLNNYLESALNEIKSFEESIYKTALTELLELLKHE